MNALKQIAKQIVIDGTKSVTVAAGVALVLTLATQGVEGVKNISVDKLVK